MINYFKQHRKIREATLFAVFSIFISLAFVLWARFDAARQENKRNREVALRQCGAMIQDGEKDDLSLIINNLLESEIFNHAAWEGFYGKRVICPRVFVRRCSLNPQK